MTSNNIEQTYRRFAKRYPPNSRQQGGKVYILIHVSRQCAKFSSTFTLSCQHQNYEKDGLTQPKHYYITQCPPSTLLSHLSPCIQLWFSACNDKKVSVPSNKKDIVYISPRLIFVSCFVPKQVRKMIKLCHCVQLLLVRIPSARSAVPIRIKGQHSACGLAQITCESLIIYGEKSKLFLHKIRDNYYGRHVRSWLPCNGILLINNRASIFYTSAS